MNVQSDVFLLGIDGGGSQCRARLCAMSGARLGEGVGGPANIRLGIEQSFGSVLQATTQCMSAAGLALHDLDRIVACLALAGASEPGHLDAALRYPHPYRTAIFVTDAQSACIGGRLGLAAMRLDWSPALQALGEATSLVNLGRGPTLAIAREAALKLKET